MKLTNEKRNEKLTVPLQNFHLWYGRKLSNQTPYYFVLLLTYPTL